MPRSSRAANPWRATEDAYLQAHWLLPLPVQAAHLGRPVQQVQQRRHTLLSSAAASLIDRPRKKPKAAAVIRGHLIGRTLRGLSD